MHYLKRPSTRIGKFALFVHFFWTPFFLGYSQGLEKCIYSLTSFHHFSFVISFPLAQLWLSATANLCKLVDVPVMVGDEPSFSGVVFSHCCSSKPRGPTNVQQRAECICCWQNRQNFKSFRQAFSWDKLGFPRLYLCYYTQLTRRNSVERMGIHSRNIKRNQEDTEDTKKPNRESVCADFVFSTSHLHCEEFSMATANLLLNSDAAC